MMRQSLFLLLLVLLLFPHSTQGQQATVQRCTIFLAASDINRDDFLNQEPEFARFVSVLAGAGQTFTTFASIPAGYQAIYTKYATPPAGLSVAGARPGTTATPEQSQALTTLCEEMLAVEVAAATTTAPLPAPLPANVPAVSTTPVAVPFQTCRVSMAVSDSNRDNSLSQSEFITFLNRLTANQGGFTTYEALPAALQTVFAQLAAPSTTDLAIAGASPVTYASSTADQKARLEQICTDVQVAIAETDPVITTTGAPGGITPAPAPASSPALPFPQCRVSLAIADRNRDNALAQDEYIAFLNRLTRNQYATTPFTGLPPELQANYNELAVATTGAIDITGAQPQQFNAATEAQKAHLEDICDETQEITSSGGSSGATPIPVSTPVPATTTAPGTVTLIPFIQCRQRMHVADTNRDTLLSPEEYSSFVDRLEPATSYTSFAALPASVQSTFTTLSASTGGQINIFGSLPSQAADPVQLEYLETVCTNTQVALQGGTLAPGTPVPGTSIAPGTLTPVPGTSIAPGTLTPGSIAPGTLTPVPGTSIAPGTLRPGSIAPGTLTPVPGSLVPGTVTPATAPPVVSVPTYSPVPLVECGNDLQLSDVNKDNLLSQEEFVQFVIYLIEGWQFNGRLYETLPQELKLVFAQFSVDGLGVVWNIAASNPNLPQQTDGTELLARACVATVDAVNAVVIRQSTPAPTKPPLVYSTLPVCKGHANSADVDQNAFLTQAEYGTFVTLMAPAPLVGADGTPPTTFTALPAVLQTNFVQLATPTGGIAVSVGGALPPTTPEQDTWLTTMCKLTDEAIYDALYGHIVTIAPNMMPTPMPTPRPTVPLPECKEDMVQSDSNQDSFIDSTEYVTYINLIGNNAFAGVLYNDLHPVLTQNFVRLASVDYTMPERAHRPDAIDVLGAQSTAIANAIVTEQQLQFLQTVCLNTTYAIQDALRPPTMAPTNAPTVSMAPSVAPPPSVAPTAYDGIEEIPSSFIIYNQVGILALDLNDDSNPNFRDLQSVYRIFAKEVVENNPWPPPATQVPGAAAGGAAPVRGLLRGGQTGRRRLVSFQANSATLLSVEFLECPPSPKLAAGGFDCQIAYARYFVEGVDSAARNQVYDYYTTLTQANIQSGVLQGVMDRENPSSRISVLGATPELMTAAPTMAPTLAANPDDPEDERSGGTIVFVVMVGLLALLALGIYFAWNDKDKIKAKWREYKRKKKDKQNEEVAQMEGQVDDVEGEEELQFDEDGNVLYPEGYEEEDFIDEFDDEGAEETGGKKKGKRAKKLLGTLKGVGKIGKHTIFGEEDEEKDDIEIMQDENVLDFDDYIFDTPAELLTEQNRRGNKLGGEAGGKDALRESTKARPALGASVVGGPGPMTDSVASSTSSMEGSGDDFDDDFDDEYDSYEDDSDDDEGEGGDSFELELSDTEGGLGDEDTISSKGGDFGNLGKRDDDSLSSSDEQGAIGDGVLGGDNIEGILAAARLNQGEGEGSEEGKVGEDEDDDDFSDSDGSSYASDSTSPSLEELRKEVKELVAKVVPEELDNLSTMMDQFEGREAELINTLQNMEERNSTQRARAAVHKTKVKVNPNQVGGYSIASEGSAVIAAASTLGPEPQRRQPRVQQYNYDDEESYYSDEDYTEGSYYSDEEGSYYSGDEEYDDEGSYYSGEEEGSYYSGDEEYDDEGSYYSGEEEGSYYSGDEEGEEGSYFSGDEEGSYYSGDEDIPEGEEGSYFSGDEEEGSYYSGDEEVPEGEEGSYFSGDEEEGSYYSGDEEVPEGEEGSYFSGDEEGGSYYSGDEEDYSGSYSDEGSEVDRK